jgi:Ca2+-binding EF-hand superfamily protein
MQSRTKTIITPTFKKIQLEELKMGLDLNKVIEYIKRINDDLDVNKDGIIDMKDLDALFDVNKDGKIDLKDLRASIDKNCDGKISFAELASFCLSVLNKLSHL